MTSPPNHGEPLTYGSMALYHLHSQPGERCQRRPRLIRRCRRLTRLRGVRQIMSLSVPLKGGPRMLILRYTLRHRQPWGTHPVLVPITVVCGCKKFNLLFRKSTDRSRR